MLDIDETIQQRLRVRPKTEEDWSLFTEKGTHIMTSLRASDEQIRQILLSSKTIAIVGLSDNPERPSYGVAAYLKDFYTIVPVNPQINTVFGLQAYPSLEAIPSDVKVDIVNIFRKSDQVMPIVESAVARKARCVWMQVGVQNTAASLFATSNGMLVVEDACIAVLHSRLARHPN